MLRESSKARLRRENGAAAIYLQCGRSTGGRRAVPGVRRAYRHAGQGQHRVRGGVNAANWSPGAGADMVKSKMPWTGNGGDGEEKSSSRYFSYSSGQEYFRRIRSAPQRQSDKLQVYDGRSASCFFSCGHQEARWPVQCCVVRFETAGGNVILRKPESRHQGLL